MSLSSDKSPLTYHAIVSIVCQVCTPTTLVTLAQTCKSVSSVALEAIWTAIPYFEVLVYTFPDDMLRNRNSWRVLARDVYEEDFTRFRRYSVLVKTVANKYKSWAHFRLSPEVWNIIVQCIGPRDFPQLGELLVEQGVLKRGSCRLSFPPPIHHFLGKSLLSFIITIPPNPSDASVIDDEEDIVDIIDAKELINLCTGLSTRSPQIQNLRITLTNFGDDVAPLLSNAILNLSRLSVCCLSGVVIHADAFERLGNLSLLTQLELDVPRMGYPTVSSKTAAFHDGRWLFPTLKYLTIRTHNLRWCTNLLRRIRSTQLQAVDFQVITHVSADKMLVFADEIASHPSALTLEVLLLWLGKSARAREGAPLPSSAFYSLTSLWALKRIWVRGECFVGLDDTTLSAMAKGWPRMERVRLLPEPRRGTDFPVTRATLSICGVFAENCPNITELCIPLEDGTPVAIRRSFATCTTRTSAMKMELLGVGPSCISIGHAASMSALMSLWFPSVRGIQFDELGEGRTTTVGHHGEVQAMQECWDAVRLDIRTHFRRVREQECRWRRECIRINNTNSRFRGGTHTSREDRTS